MPEKMPGGNPLRRIARVMLILLAVGGLLFANQIILAQTAVQARVSFPTPPVRLKPRSQLLYGVISDTGEHYADLWARGIRATTIEFHWKFYEPQQGVYDQNYIDHIRQVLMGLKAQGWYVQMIPGYQYTPAWVYATYPDIFYVNQYGEKYAPNMTESGDFQVINAPFNPQARALIAGYLQRIFQDFDQSDPLQRFDSVRVGGVVQGELRYPPPDREGLDNAYWAFDPYAQNPAISGIPPEAVGWRPGIDPNPGTTGHGQLIVNPGFEQTSANYPILGWSPDDEVMAEVITANPHGGSRLLRLSIASANRIHQYVRVLPSTTYHFGGWLRSGEGAGAARLFLIQHDAATQPVENAPFGKLETTNTGWTYLEGTLTTQAETQFLKVALDGDQPGDFYFDDLWLKRQGEADNRNREISVPVAFYDWYVKALSDYQNWQINEIRKYYDGQLDLTYPGKGISRVQVSDALTNDLHGDGWSEGSSALYAAAVFDRHVSSLPSTQGIALYVTGFDEPPAAEVNDNSPYPHLWSAARWMAYLAQSRGMSVWGENSGEDDLTRMKLTIERMYKNNFLGMLWAFESELYAYQNGWATIDDYAALMAYYANLEKLFLPLLQKR